MKVLVTGANGFIGKALTQHLISLGHETWSVVRHPTGISNPQILWGDDQSKWNLALEACDCIVHLAGHANSLQENEEKSKENLRATNVDLSVALVNRAISAGVKRLVFLSTIKVNGESTQSNCPFKSEDAPAPEDLYALTKYEAEQELVKAAQKSGLELLIIRPPLVYGPEVKGNFSFLIKLITMGVPLPLKAVKNKRSLIALDNLVDFIALCADPTKSPQAANQTFLVSDGEDVPTPELLRKIGRAYGRKARLLPVPVSWMRCAATLLGKEAIADRLFGSLVVDSSKARELLGWKPVITMDEQLCKMARYDQNV